MIVKTLTSIEVTESEVISKGAVGYCSETWLVGTGGFEGKYRIVLCRKFVSGLPLGALAMYEFDCEDLGKRFKEIKNVDLSVCEKQSLTELDATLEKA